MHAAVLAYASDMGLLGTSKHNVPSVAISVIASLDHTIWFHSPFRADRWLLYYLESQRATDGRGAAFGLVFTETGVLAATVGMLYYLFPPVCFGKAPTHFGYVNIPTNTNLNSLGFCESRRSLAQEGVIRLRREKPKL